MSDMRKIPVEQLKPGMIYDQPLYVDKSNILVAANTAISESDIKKLMTWGVAEIETMGKLIGDKVNPDTPVDNQARIISEYNNLLKRRKDLITVHQKARKSVEGIYNAIRKDESFDMAGIEESSTEIINLLNETSNIFLFLYGLDEGKDYLVTHSVNVTFYSVIMGLALKYPMKSLKELAAGTMLIDAGMLKMPVYIIHKQSNLTDQEYQQIKTHPLHGYKVLRQLGDLNERIANVTLQHHEQFDGKGYPRGLKGNEISEYARIASIADSYESQISKRSYRQKVYFYHAMRNLLSSGVNRFDPVILRVFLSRMSVYPIGSIVELNDKTVGIIIGSIPEKPLRPIIKMIIDEDKKRVEGTKIVNLLDETSLYIVRALDEEEVGINIFDVL